MGPGAGGSIQRVGRRGQTRRRGLAHGALAAWGCPGGWGPATGPLASCPSVWPWWPPGLPPRCRTWATVPCQEHGLWGAHAPLKEWEFSWGSMSCLHGLTSYGAGCPSSSNWRREPDPDFCPFSRENPSLLQGPGHRRFAVDLGAAAGSVTSAPFAQMPLMSVR